MYIHNGSWPFRCSICYRGFSKQTNLKNHISLHSGMCHKTWKLLLMVEFLGSKPHMCSVCGKSFALQCNLKAHIKLHVHYKRSSDDGDKKECVLQQETIFPGSYSFEYPQQFYYNSILHYGFDRMFPFNQRPPVQCNDKT